MNQKTVLVLGTNAGQADLIRHMKQRGWHVVACSGRAGEPGADLADAVHQIDFSNTDAVVELAKACGADLVYSVSSDIAMVQAVKASEQLGTPFFFGSELVDILNSKQDLRTALNAANISKVPFVHVSHDSDLAHWDSFPCVVKPTDAQGQRGVQVVHDSKELLPAVETARGLSSDKTALVEAYLEGVEISVNVLVRDRKVVIDEVSERLVHKDVGFGIPKGHLVPPYNVSTQAVREARSVVAAVVDLFAIAAGCLYFQMKVTPYGVKIIEIAPRLDGCHMWRCIKVATGTDFLEATVDTLLGEPSPIERNPQKQGLYTELMFQQLPSGKPFSTDDFPVPPDAHYHEYRYKTGDTVTPINGHLEVIGYYVRVVDADEAQKYRGFAPSDSGATP